MKKKLKKPEYAVPANYFEKTTLRFREIPLQERLHARLRMVVLAAASLVALAIVGWQFLFIDDSKSIPYWETVAFEIETSDAAYIELLLPELLEEDLQADFSQMVLQEWEADFLLSQEYLETTELTIIKTTQHEN